VNTRETQTAPLPADLVETNIPARLDRLPWSRFHWLVVLGLGTVWVLDGLEVTIVGAIGAALTSADSGLQLSESEVALAATAYILGACLGALLFGRLTDQFGRKKLFLVTLGVYLTATVLTAFSPNPLWFYACRFFTGAGIGGEYAAINSAIDELMPARVRGRVDLAINGSFWVGTFFGSLLAVPLLDTALFPAYLGWRLAFGVGALFGLCVLLVRRSLPESPRWMFLHGHAREAEALVSGIEREIEREKGLKLPPVHHYLRVRDARSIGLGELVRAMVTRYRKRFVLGLALFIGQAFLYNAVFFTQVLVLTRYFGVSVKDAPLYLLPLAVGNFIGPVALGPLFDRVGRKVMIAASYIGSGILLVGTGLLFERGLLDSSTLTLCWCVVFFFASAGASSAYLTVSEIFPMETRAMAISFNYAVGTAIGGACGPLVFGRLIESASPANVAIGYYIGAALMIAAGIVEIWLGVEAAQKSLEEIAPPLSEHGSGRDREPAPVPYEAAS
jgi:MFS family permease